MGDWARILADASVQGRTTAQHNRELVLRYPDIAAKLTAPPFKCADPRAWSGFVPGALCPEDVRGRVALNQTPIRAQLLAILHEAAQRADAQSTALTGAPS